MNDMKYSYRFLARFVIETETPLAVGSGEKDITTDALVATDVNGLPYIPGTAIAGVMRHMVEELRFDDFDINETFGFQSRKDGQGSKIIFTEAKILNSKGEVVDGMDLDAIKEDPLLKMYAELPIRQHVRINEKGVTDKAGKFDEQVCFAGTRFCFEIEIVDKDDKEKNNFEQMLNQFFCQTFRIGGGTRCGFGKIRVVDLQVRSLDLKKNSSDLQLYLEKPSRLSEQWQGWEKRTTEANQTNGWTKYELNLTPDDFFLFGSGFGDDEADITPVKAKRVDWSSGYGELIDDQVLIPATSVKGALAHRVAFHYNRLKKRFAGCTGDMEPKVGNENEAVQTLFGYENQKEKKQARGNLIFSDVIENEMIDKVLNHVSIDRFTGGAIDGALFSEKATYGKGRQFVFTILAKTSVLNGDNIQESLESAMIDICNGLLPLGGGVNRGNGVFSGSLKRDNELIFPGKEGQK